MVGKHVTWSGSEFVKPQDVGPLARQFVQPLEAGNLLLPEPIESDPRIARLARLILAEALNQGAAAIHVRPTKDGAQLTNLIGGTWIDRNLIPVRVLPPLAERFRAIGGLDPDGRRGRVDYGEIHFPHRGREYTFLLEITELAAGPDVLIQLHEPAA